MTLMFLGGAALCLEFGGVRRRACPRTWISDARCRSSESRSAESRLAKIAACVQKSHRTKGPGSSTQSPSFPDSEASKLIQRHLEGWRAYIRRKRGSSSRLRLAGRMACHVRAFGKRVSGVSGRFHWVRAKPRIHQRTFPSWNPGAVRAFCSRTYSYSRLRAPGTGPMNDVRPLLREIYLGGSRLRPPPCCKGETNHIVGLRRLYLGTRYAEELRSSDPKASLAQ